jgi:homoserine/homoserine lactone efflux protein
MRLDLWLVFLVTETVLSLTPGPAVLLIIAEALRSGTRAALWSIVGILAGNTVYFVLSATTLGALLLASYDLFFLIKWVGAAYLVFLGLRALFAPGPDVTVAVVEGQPGRRALGAFGTGFVTQISNPKAIVFFASILPQFIDTREPLAPQVAILALTSVVAEFFVLAGYGLVAGRGAQLARDPRYARLTTRISGTVLVMAGCGLALLRRNPR